MVTQVGHRRNNRHGPWGNHRYKPGNYGATFGKPNGYGYQNEAIGMRTNDGDNNQYVLTITNMFCDFVAEPSAAASNEGFGTAATRQVTRG